MSIPKSFRKARASLVLEGFSVTDLVHIRKEMEVFAQVAKETDRFHVQVLLSLNAGRGKAIRVSGQMVRDLAEQYRNALGLKTVSELCSYLEISRQNMYGWFRGASISRRLFERLVEKAPTQALKEMVLEIRAELS